MRDDHSLAEVVPVRGHKYFFDGKLIKIIRELNSKSSFNWT